MKLALTLFITVGILSATPSLQVTRTDASTLLVKGASQEAMSIDFDDISQIGSSWAAHLSDASGDISHTYYPFAPDVYKEEAFLWERFEDPGISQETKTELQFAAWYLTDHNFFPLLDGFIKKPPKNNPENGLFQVFSGIALDVKLAQQGFNDVNLTGFEIVSQARYSEGWFRNEEFIYRDAAAVPEPATTALLAVSLALAGMGQFLYRRKRLANCHVPAKG